MTTPTGDEIMEWVRQRFPDRAHLEARAMKLAEEAGEVVGAVTRIAEGRGKAGHLAQELAQLTICARSVAAAGGIDLEAAVAAEWNDIQTREWPTTA